MSYVVNPAFFNSASPSILVDLCESFTVLVLYTIYVILFLFSLYTIVHRNANGRRFMLVMSSGMFLLATSGMLISVMSAAVNISITRAIIHGDSVGTEHLLRLYDNLQVAYAIRLTTNNLLTDSLFLYRCYVIWGSRRTVLIIPGLFVFATCLLGYLCTASDDFNNSLLNLDPRVPYIVGGATNVILMCLTAGRIWYKSQEARHVDGNAFRTRYHTAIAMIVESGALYCVVLLIKLISLSFVLESDAGAVFQGVCYGLVEQMINILPTFIFVRVGLGYCQWIQESPPLHVRHNIPVRTPKLQEEDICSEVIEIE
ncbi:hypothetical protein C8R45DRAFT_1099509 [Mycena sanguinolenta]|nr:hypothetical protein C8R45DRAFT_1099509 [Mycena sanguinolenta]